MINFVQIRMLVAIAAILIGQSDAAEWMEQKADYIKSCRINDPEFTKCSTESIQMLLSHLSKDGIEGFDEKIDPLRISKIRIFQGQGPVSINSSLSKAVVTGFSNMKVVESKVSPKDYSWETKIYLPKMRLEGNYYMQGRILVIPLIGHGKCWFEPNDMQIVMNTKTQLYEKYGHTFYNVTSVKVDYTLKGLKLRLENLFDGVDALDDTTNQYLNENWRPVSEALKPIIAQTIQDILMGVLQKLFHFLPADYLISDIPTPKELYGN